MHLIGQLSRLEVLKNNESVIVIEGTVLCKMNCSLYLNKSDNLKLMVTTQNYLSSTDLEKYIIQYEMKKITLLLFTAIFMVNIIFAQSVNTGQKVMANQINAQELLPGSRMANPLFQFNFPLVFPNSPEKQLKSAGTIKLDSVIISKHSSVSEHWTKLNKQFFEYDNELRLVKIATTSGLNDSGIYPETALFKYNSAGLVDTVKLYYIGDQMKDMSQYGYIKLSYDDSGKLLKSYSYVLYNNNWELYMGYNYTYNQSDKVIEIFLEENWWAYWTSLHKYTYDQEGKLIRYEEEPWYSILTTYNYDAEGNLIEENYQDWYQKRKHLYYYNQDGDRVKSERYYWIDNELQEHSIEEYSYLDLNYSDLADMNLSILNLTNELDEVEYIPNKLISSITEDGKKTEYFYSSITDDSKILTDIKETQHLEFTLYPNPVTDQITFTWNEGLPVLNLKIYLITGACVIDKEIFSNETVHLEKLNTGVYLYKLTDKNTVLKSGKLIIK